MVFLASADLRNLLCPLTPALSRAGEREFFFDCTCPSAADY